MLMVLSIEEQGCLRVECLLNIYHLMFELNVGQSILLNKQCNSFLSTPVILGYDHSLAIRIKSTCLFKNWQNEYATHTFEIPILRNCTFNFSFYAWDHVTFNSENNM